MAESIYQDPAVTLAPQQPEPAHASQGEGVVQFRFPGARTIQTVTGIAAGVLLELIVCLNGGTEGPSTMERRAEWAKGIEILRQLGVEIGTLYSLTSDIELVRGGFEDVR